MLDRAVCALRAVERTLERAEDDEGESLDNGPKRRPRFRPRNCEGREPFELVDLEEDPSKQGGTCIFRIVRLFSIEST